MRTFGFRRDNPPAQNRLSDLLKEAAPLAREIELSYDGIPAARQFLAIAAYIAPCETGRVAEKTPVVRGLVEALLELMKISTATNPPTHEYLDEVLEKAQAAIWKAEGVDPR